MSKAYKNLGWLIGVGCFFTSLPLSAQMVVLYDNSAPPSWSDAYPTAVNVDTDEFGDEITLAASTPRIVDTFKLQYFGQNFTGGIQIKFYQNDSPRADLGPGVNEPGTLLYQSPVVPVTGLNAHAELTLSGINVTVPDSFTWTVQFTGVTTGESAGVAVHGPPATGSSYADYWERNASAWSLYSFPSLPSNFAAQITAVPEPGSCALVVSLGLLAWTKIRRIQKPDRA